MIIYINLCWFWYHYNTSVGVLEPFDDDFFFQQVVTLSVYTYFLAALIGAQMIPLSNVDVDRKSDDIDLYFPIITVLEVFKY